jgi:hypothetical protein
VPEWIVFCHPALGTPLDPSKLDDVRAEGTRSSRCGGGLPAVAGHAQESATGRYLHATRTSYPDATALAEPRLFGAKVDSSVEDAGRDLALREKPRMSRAFFTPRVGLEPTTLRLTAGPDPYTCSASFRRRARFAGTSRMAVASLRNAVALPWMQGGRRVGAGPRRPRLAHPRRCDRRSLAAPPKRCACGEARRRASLEGRVGRARNPHCQGRGSDALARCAHRAGRGDSDALVGACPVQPGSSLLSALAVGARGTSLREQRVGVRDVASGVCRGTASSSGRRSDPEHIRSERERLGRVVVAA